MKPVFVLAFAALVVGNTLGFYLQNPGHASGCGCGGSIVNIPLDQLPVAGQQQQPDDGTRYKYDFGMQQPRADAAKPQLNSYGYQIQEPAEPRVDDTKYKYDYTLQQPMDEKVAAPQKPTLNTKVDRVVQDKPECTCAAGSPCTCGYSAPINTNNAYVLPVRYNNGGDYVVYELPQEEQTRYLHRVARQAPAGQTPTTPDASAIVEHFQKVAAAFRDRASRLIPANSGGEQRVGSILGASLDSTLGSTNTADQSNSRAANVQALKEKFSSIAEPIVGMIKESFATVSRSKRDTMDTEHRTNEPTMPVLRVKEYNPSNEETRYSKHMSTHMGRIELQTPAYHAKDIKEMEKASRCHSCGTKLTHSTCSHCGQYQPQYIQYIEGKQVPFYPGAVQENQQQQQPAVNGAETTRYIYDRYGHKYLENDGKLRLVRNQPDYAGLASILSENDKVMKQINQTPDRLVEEPASMVSGLTHLVRDLVRYQRNPRNAAGDATTRSMYQVVPMQYDGKDGKLVVQIYDNKNQGMDAATAQKVETTTVDRTNEMEKQQPGVKKYVKNNKPFEIISFNDNKPTENIDDDIRRVLEHLHGKQQW